MNTTDSLNHARAIRRERSVTPGTGAPAARNEVLTLEYLGSLRNVRRRKPETIYDYSGVVACLSGRG